MNSPRLSAIATAVALIWAANTPAHAVVVYSGALNLVIPNSNSGLYINVINGSTYTGPDLFPSLGGPGANYDLNIFGTSSWSFFAATTFLISDEPQQL